MRSVLAEIQGLPELLSSAAEALDSAGLGSSLGTTFGRGVTEKTATIVRETADRADRAIQARLDQAAQAVGGALEESADRAMKKAAPVLIAASVGAAMFGAVGGAALGYAIGRRRSRRKDDER